MTLDDLGFSVSNAELDNAHFHFLTRRRSTDENQQSVKTRESAAIP